MPIGRLFAEPSGVANLTVDNTNQQSIVISFDPPSGNTNCVLSYDVYFNDRVNKAKSEF